MAIQRSTQNSILLSWWLWLLFLLGSFWGNLRQWGICHAICLWTLLSSPSNRASISAQLVKKTGHCSLLQEFLTSILYYHYHLPSLVSHSAVQPSSALLWWIAFLWHRSACTTHRCTCWDDQILRMEPQNFESTSRGSHSSIPWYKSENGKWASPTFSSFQVLIHKQNKRGKRKSI